MSDKKRNAVSLDDEQLENASGGYGIIHRHDGYKQLVDDKGNLIDKKFVNTYRAEDYADRQKSGFDQGKKWEVY